MAIENSNNNTNLQNDSNNNEPIQGQQVDNQNNNPDNSSNNEPERVFTQAELNKLLKSEKEKSKAALLKELGVSDFNTAKDGLAKYLQSVEDSKSDLQKAQEANAQMSEELKEKNGKVAFLQASFDAISCGVNPTVVSDIIPIVLAKVTEENDVKSVIEDMKKNPAFSGFFTSVPNSGTGNPIPRKQNVNDNGTESYGARLAKSKVKSRNTNTN
nr:MAG TPA: Major capsid protein [Caudoviricetes sp.]